MQSSDPESSVRRSGASASTQRDSTRLMGVWGVVCWRDACGVFAQGGGRDAVHIYCSNAALESLRSLRSGVIADFGDDAGTQMRSFAVNSNERFTSKSEKQMVVDRGLLLAQ